MTEELKTYFQDAFDVAVLRVNIVAHHATLSHIGHSPVVSTQDAPFYEVSVTCCPVHSLPVEPLQWFDMRDCGHALHFIKTTHEPHAFTLELRYRTADLEKFTLDVKNSDYRRYSTKFHQQLEEILDDGTEE